jgi:hypothetical protein
LAYGVDPATRRWESRFGCHEKSPNSRIIHEPKKPFSRLVLALSVNFTFVKEGNLALYQGGTEMNTTERPTRGSTTAGFPALRLSKPETADRGTVRLGFGCITAGFPALRQPKPETADRGTVRLGFGCITGAFPINR